MARTDPRTMSKPTRRPQPPVFTSWSALAAAAKNGDARARDFLLTYVPWMVALRDTATKH